MRPSVNPGLVLALQSLHAHLLFACNPKPPETDRQTGRDACRLSLPRAHRWKRGRLGDQTRVFRYEEKKHQEALGDTEPLLSFTGFKVEF